MNDRPSLVIRLEDSDGCAGWGEVWCNFPTVGGEHRARLLETLLLPALSDLSVEVDTWNAWQELSAQYSILALQAGEQGPFAQCIAAIDCALWDLRARRRNLPLFRYLSDSSKGTVKIYASGINPDEIDARVSSAVASGFSACKIKVGFELNEDVHNVNLARNILGPDRELMVDANQGWDNERSLKFLAAVPNANLSWLEEPLCHDAPDVDWKQLSVDTNVRLAAGENFASLTDFQSARRNRGIQVVQPDLGKWGGVSGMVQVASIAEATDLTFCPHWLGGGIGLLTSLHVKAAHAHETGYVEVDVNPNASRSIILECAGIGLGGDRLNLPTAAGIGIVDDGIKHLQPFLYEDIRNVIF